jgi:hypothetical protein
MSLDNRSLKGSNEREAAFCFLSDKLIIRFAGFPVEPVEPVKRGMRSDCHVEPANGHNLLTREHFSATITQPAVKR